VGINLKTLFILFYANAVFAQCSDAGVCIIGSKELTHEHQINLSYILGKSGKEDDLTFNTVQLEANIQLLNNSKLSLLLPWSHISGPLGNASGPGDFILLWNQTVLLNGSSMLNIQAGGKFASGSSNEKNLPQAYQPGLGTNDLLLGISYETDPWLFAIGYQLSRGRSDNALTKLKRGDDFFARIGYKIQADIFKLGLEILSIKRLQESSVLDSASLIDEAYITIPGSDQFQINILGRIYLPVHNNYGIQSIIAIPLLKRDINVDGLKRSFSFSIGAQFLF